MDSNSVWEFLSSIPIGTVVAWIIVIFTIIAVICAGTIKLYKLFFKYTKVKDENEKRRQLIKKHDEVLDQVNESLKKITDSLDEQKKENEKEYAQSGKIEKMTIEAEARNKMFGRNQQKESVKFIFFDFFVEKDSISKGNVL